jgi:hypothetical protein
VRGELSAGLAAAFEEEGDGADEDGDFELDGDEDGDLAEELPDFPPPLLPPPPLPPPPPFSSFGEFRKTSWFGWIGCHRSGDREFKPIDLARSCITFIMDASHFEKFVVENKIK